jgi:hypothetical protein
MKSYSRTMIRLAATTCSLLLITTSVFSQQKKPATESRSNVERNSMKDQPIACNLFGLTPAERQRQKELRDQIFSGSPTVKELTNGYAVGLPSTRENILAVAEFISLERVCCSFFHFDLAVGQSEEPLWLRITGKSGVKEFLKTELMKR